MLKYFQIQLTKCEENIRKQLYVEHHQGRLAFLTDLQLFELISSGEIRCFGSMRNEFSSFEGSQMEENHLPLRFIVPSMSNLLFSPEQSGQIIGLTTRYHQESILFLNVRFLVSFRN